MLLNSYVKKLGIKQYNNYIDYAETKQTDTFLLNLYAFIFVHYSKSIHTVKYLESRTTSRISGTLNNNFYFIYNSVYFSTSRVRRSKFSLSEFLSTKMDTYRNIVSFHKTKKKIGFGKLT